MEYTPRFQRDKGAVLLNYRIDRGIYFNDQYDEDFEYEHCWYIGARFNAKWFEYDEWYYGGYYAKSLTIFGICLIKGFTWQNESAWRQQKL